MREVPGSTPGQAQIAFFFQEMINVILSASPRHPLGSCYCSQMGLHMVQHQLHESQHRKHSIYTFTQSFPRSFALCWTFVESTHECKVNFSHNPRAAKAALNVHFYPPRKHQRNACSKTGELDTISNNNLRGITLRHTED